MVLLTAAAGFSVQQPLVDPAEISRQFRSFLKIEDQRLKMAHARGAPGCPTAEAAAAVLDLVVERSFRAAISLCQGGGFYDEIQNGCAVVAMGGYGRGELAPYSDLDILFLHHNYRALQARQLVEQILRLLWDTGLTVGHSFRGVDDCGAATRNDPHLQTALVSTRLLAGSEATDDALLKALEKKRRQRTGAFITAIKHERDVRDGEIVA